MSKKSVAELAEAYKQACKDLDFALAAFTDSSSQDQKNKVIAATKKKKAAFAAYSRAKKAEFRKRI